MDFVLYEIEALVQMLTDLEKMCTSRLADCPPGKLIRIMKGEKPVFMQSIPEVIASGQRRYRKTVLHENSDLLKQLVFKEFLHITQRNLNHNIRRLERAKAGLLPLSFDAVCEQMGRPYRSVSNMASSIQFPSMDFLSGSPLRRQHQWAAESYEQSTYRPEEKTHFTSRGLAMRTRAELLIAEMLYRYDIPFRYEQVIRIGKYDLAPDFTFLDCNGEEFYWEYCGMMSYPKYREHQLWRRNMYESIGINEWMNMIYTYDAADSVDMREIEAIIKTKILPRMQGNSSKDWPAA